MFSYVPKVSSNFGSSKPRLDLKHCLEFLLPLILCISVKHNNLLTAHLIRAIFIWPWKKFCFTSVCYSFYQPMDEKIKTWPLCFPTKENPNMKKALFDWPIVLQYDVKAKHQFISRKFFELEVFSAKCSLNQPKTMHVCICSTNQYFHSFVVSVLFARFHFKVIWKSL